MDIGGLVTLLFSGGVVSYALGWLSGRKKNQAHLEGIRLQNLKSAIDIYEKVCSEYEKVHSELKEQLKELSNRCKELSEEIESLRHENLSLKKEIKSLNERLKNS